MDTKYLINMKRIKDYLDIKVQEKKNFYNCLFNLHQKQISEDSHNISQNIYRAVTNKGKLIVCGNGGSHAQASHLSAELLIRFKANSKRPHFPAIALGSDATVSTACSNDYGYENIFKTQLKSLLDFEDCFIAFSTSGLSPNVINAINYAKDKINSKNIFLITGNKKVNNLNVEQIICPLLGTTETYQEYHLILIHMICNGLEVIYD